MNDKLKGYTPENDDITHGRVVRKPPPYVYTKKDKAEAIKRKKEFEKKYGA